MVVVRRPRVVRVVAARAPAQEVADGTTNRRGNRRAAVHRAPLNNRGTVDTERSGDGVVI